jgi:prepilin-type N-terminal cleavage/methylation domain-containing protein
MSKNNSKAFSLIELSIVILVVGVLIAGVMQGTNMVKKSQLQAARNLTTSSPVNGVKDLMLWYETSLESSFKTTEAENNTQISVWYDNNKQLMAKNNATQSAPDDQPKFIENVFGAIPAIKFSNYVGNGHHLLFDGKFLVGNNYTIFVVEQRTAAASAYFIQGSTGGAPGGRTLNLGYKYDYTLTQSHWANDLDFAIPTYSSPKKSIHTFWFSKTAGKKYWFQGGRNPDKSEPTQTTALIDYNGSRLGSRNGVYYNGDIAEVIIFARDLKNEERQAIEAYLSKKYNIAITG